MAEERPERIGPIWPLAMLSIPIGAILAAVSAAGHLEDEPLPDGSVASAVGEIVGYALAAAVFGAAIVWALFWAINFRRHPPGKYIGVLMISIVAAFALAAPTRFISIGARNSSVHRWQESTDGNIQALSARLTSQLTELHLSEVLLEGLTTTEAVQEKLARHRAGIGHLNAYRLDIDEEFTRAEADLEAIPLTENDRAEILADLRKLSAPDSRLHRSCELQQALLHKGEEVLVFLLDHRDSWVWQDGRVTVDSPALLAQIERLGAEYQAIGLQLRALNEPPANAEGATPTGSAPPPPQ